MESKEHFFVLRSMCVGCQQLLLLLGVLIRVFFVGRFNNSHLWTMAKIPHQRWYTKDVDQQFRYVLLVSDVFIIPSGCATQPVFVGYEPFNHNWLPWVAGNWRNMCVALSQVGTVCCLEGTWYCLFSVLSSAMVIVTWRCLVFERWKELDRYVFDVKEESWWMSQTFWRVVIWIILEFTPSWGYDPICLTCFRRVETTN